MNTLWKYGKSLMLQKKTKNEIKVCAKCFQIYCFSFFLIIISSYRI